MYIGAIRRKKINLWLLILLILFIVAIVFTAIHMMNSTKANSDSRYDQTNKLADTNTTEYSGSRIGKVNSYDSFSNIENKTSDSQVPVYSEIPNQDSGTIPVSTPVTPLQSRPSTGDNSSPINLGNHTYSFQNLGEFILGGQQPNQYIELKRENLLYRVITEKKKFNDILNGTDLKKSLEEMFSIQVTSEIKTGTINDTQIIVCTIADNSSVGYLFITPLNDDESMFLRVYNANNMFELIQDISNPISDISLLKENIQ